MYPIHARCSNSMIHWEPFSECEVGYLEVHFGFCGNFNFRIIFELLFSDSECKIPGKSNILAFPQVGWGFELRRALVGWGGVGAFLTFTSSFKFTSS